MSRKGWLEATRDGRHAYYGLSGRGRALLEEGEARIYNPPRDAEWDGEWTLVVGVLVAGSRAEPRAPERRAAAE